MNWAEKIITDRELAEFSERSPRGELASRVAALIEHQKRNWPLLREGYESLNRADVRTIALPGTTGTEVVLQLNPRRIRSTAASVDKASVAARRCFLCPDSLPPEEKGIAYGDNLIVMCNPYPVLDRHLSIIHRQHIPQSIVGNVEPLLDLARELGPTFFVLYNGPLCGASAPDHLHFQACSRSVLPIEYDLHREAGTRAYEPVEPLVALKGCGRSVLIFRDNDAAALARSIYRTLEALASQIPQAEGPLSSNDTDARAGGDDSAREPMVNIIVTHDEPGWTVYLFPRARHRPAVFYADGDDRLTVSPGAIDMAGVVVMPNLDEFERITPPQVAEIFSEVSLSQNMVDTVVTSSKVRS